MDTSIDFVGIGSCTYIKQIMTSILIHFITMICGIVMGTGGILCAIVVDTGVHGNAKERNGGSISSFSWPCQTLRNWKTSGSCTRIPVNLVLVCVRGF